MGFGQAMKAANMNFGKVDSPDFKNCYLTLKSFKDSDGTFLIVGAQAGEYEFTHDDIKALRIVAFGSGWIKWYFRFKDGKVAIVTSPVDDPSQQKGATQIKMAPLERFFGDLLYKDEFIKHCPECGAEIDDEMLFCGECGKKLK